MQELSRKQSKRNKHVGVYNLCDEVRCRSWSVILNMLFCWGGFQGIAYWSTKAGSTWLPITSLLVVSSKPVIYSYYVASMVTPCRVGNYKLKCK